MDHGLQKNAAKSLLWIICAHLALCSTVHSQIEPFPFLRPLLTPTDEILKSEARTTGLPEDNGFIGLYADAESTQECLAVAPGQVATIHVIATTGGGTSDGFTGVEFRIEISNADGYIFSFIANPSAVLTLGNPIDTTPDDPNDARGASIAWSECQTVTGQAGDRILIGTIQVVNINGGPTELAVKRRFIPPNPRFPFPLFTQCDVPAFTKVTMRQCATDSFGESIAYQTMLNDPQCAATCNSDCSRDPRLEVDARFTEFYCPGKPVTMQIRVHNVSTQPENVEVFVDRQLLGSFPNLAPGDSLILDQEIIFNECGVRSFAVGFVATNNTCPDPWGVEDFAVTTCLSNCPIPSECAGITLDIPSSVQIGEDFDVFVRIGTDDKPITDLFGFAGNLLYDDSVLKVIEVGCTDENGAPLDLGGSALCIAQTDIESGVVEFATSNLTGDPGRSGSLRVARIRFKMREAPPESVCASECAVWPGDTNNDGNVDEDDIVALVTFWGDQGPVRLTSGCFWAESVGLCFSNPESNHADASGNGSVGVEDLLCIGANWSRTHVAEGQPVTLPARDSADLQRRYQMLLNFLATNAEDPTRDPLQRALTNLIEDLGVPKAAGLQQNVPNPFNPSTRIDFDVTERARVKIVIYDTLGRRVRELINAPMPSGRHFVTWNGRDQGGRHVPSGIYYYRAEIGSQSFSRRMVLAR